MANTESKRFSDLGLSSHDRSLSQHTRLKEPPPRRFYSRSLTFCFTELKQRLIGDRSGIKMEGLQFTKVEGVYKRRERFSSFCIQHVVRSKETHPGESRDQ
jgi:hypothetical protein